MNQDLNKHLPVLRSMVGGVGVLVLVVAIFGPVTGSQRVQLVFAALLDFACIGWSYIWPKIMGKDK